MKFSLRLWKYSFMLNSAFIKTPTNWTGGTINRTKDGKYCFYADYDNMYEDWVKDELLYLQEKYSLGDIHIFKSSEKSYHAISFVKLNAVDYMKILEESSCDESFKKVPRWTSYRGWVLRHFSKGNKEPPKYLYTLEAPTEREHSLAHFNIISKIYPEIKKSMNSEYDEYEEMDMIKYPTAKV